MKLTRKTKRILKERRNRRLFLGEYISGDDKGNLIFNGDRLGLHNLKQFKQELREYNQFLDKYNYHGEVRFDIRTINDLDEIGLAVLLSVEAEALIRGSQINLLGIRENVKGEMERHYFCIPHNYESNSVESSIERERKVSALELFSSPSKYKDVILGH